MRRVVSFTGSVLIHLTVLGLFLWGPPVGRSSNGSSSQDSSQRVSVRLIPKSVSVDLQAPPSEGALSKTSSSAAEERICRDHDETYQGIGIIYAPLSSIILDAPESYPGYKAGLREGDMILDHQEPDNGYVVYRVLRGQDQLTFRIKQEKICYEQKKEEQNGT